MTTKTSPHTPEPWHVSEIEPEQPAIGIYNQMPLHGIWADGVLVARTCFAPASLPNALLLAQAPTLLRQRDALLEALKAEAVCMGFAHSSNERWGVRFKGQIVDLLPSERAANIRIKEIHQAAIASVEKGEG